MQLEIRGTRQITVVCLSGKLDGSTAWQVKHTLDGLLKSAKGSRLQLDFQRVRQWERFGAAILARSLKQMGTRFREVTLIGVDAALEKAFKSLGLGTNVVLVS